jgi:hypothetical protein
VASFLDCARQDLSSAANGMPPNLLANYLYLWETTVVRQTSADFYLVRRTFLEFIGASDVTILSSEDERALETRRLKPMRPKKNLSCQ